MKDFVGPKIPFEELKEEELLGEGGAAFVSKGEWEGKQVAIKKLKVPETASTLGFEDEEEETFSNVFKEFRREISVMSGLEHPNLVNLIGVCLDPLCIVTEFMAYGDLYNFLQDTSRDLDLALRLKIAIDIASGMLFLHSAKPPIIHRDLKSPNVLMAAISVNAPVVAKVADFGLSGAMQTVSIKSVANPIWLAPEIMIGGEFTEAADVYSYGVILWEILHRKQPWEDIRFINEIEQKVKKGERPPILGECPPAYAELVSLCWTQDPTKRPPFKEIFERLVAIKQEFFPTDENNKEEKEESIEKKKRGNDEDSGSDESDDSEIDDSPAPKNRISFGEEVSAFDFLKKFGSDELQRKTN